MTGIYVKLSGACTRLNSRCALHMSVTRSADDGGHFLETKPVMREPSQHVMSAGGHSGGTTGAGPSPLPGTWATTRCSWCRSGTAGWPVAALIVGTLRVTLALYGNLREPEFALRGPLFPLALIVAGLAAVNGEQLSVAATPSEARNVLYGAALAALALALCTRYGVQNARYLKRKQLERSAGAPPREIRPGRRRSGPAPSPLPC